MYPVNPSPIAAFKPLIAEFIHDDKEAGKSIRSKRT
jgi:hypothetical protein